MKTSILVILILELMFSCLSREQNKSEFIKNQTDSVIVRPDFNKYFIDCRVEGSVAIYDNSNKKWILSDTIGVNLETLPASTFKVINLLIALETQTIKNENQIVQWVGSTDTVKYGYRPEIYHDMTVKEAFEVSAGWVFVELAKKIGKEKYRKYLKASGYGNGDLSQTDADFWNFGAFGISPINQVNFLRKLYENKQPFSKENMAIVKKVMINEQNQSYILRAKTGWTRDKGINTGWWIGYIEKGSNVYFFATRLLQDRKNNRADFDNCRKEITKKILTDIGAWDQ
ncbi:penicillin-binding transpeptidase domain-containing protein [Lacihabitans soyangensis]|uniref:beta-lactamase n=1 Tax=Lacihabitans soyangensis TaxID=869394 RepID=A0AAE3KT31_9BACT|nr:penicillin-binding transpeptidase domain-containing protein [Lacihabitans soyangensis]MCP9763269.1 class D beta-lactamase [Lacihabitans soyangensis]